MTAIPATPALVFTDMDGTLLDHDSYSFEPAVPMLQALDRAAVPVIPTTGTLPDLTCHRICIQTPMKNHPVRKR